MDHSGAARVRTDLEAELTWRKDEIRNLRNLEGLEPSASAACRRRALLVMLYAHLEGFVRFALEQYAAAINNAKLTVHDAKPVLCAAALGDCFKQYRSSETSDASDPAGNRARQIMRDAELFSEIHGMLNKTIQLKLDVVASTDSNLSVGVLRRNLSFLGLEDPGIHRFTASVGGLLKMRNGIAHGESINMPSDPSFQRLEERIFGLCEELMLVIYESVRDEAYRM